MVLEISIGQVTDHRIGDIVRRIREDRKELKMMRDDEVYSLFNFLPGRCMMSIWNRYKIRVFRSGERRCNTLATRMAILC